ncbi:peptidoglycan peptidase [Ruegeria sp. EL01]|uniref:peptidoglycan peptidase n=1 Tax=Ruegeria sp. EL01 TaxID=2107578 RepID=UPI0013C3FD21|nr:peptidoglycan peptidase [Ruegeria sp. EL01]
MNPFACLSKNARNIDLRFASVVACLACWTITPPVHAGEYDEAVWDWRAGDLIFRSGIDPFDDLIATYAGAQFGSAAIVRASSGGPRVVYVDPDIGVTEIMLDEFVAGLDESDYAAYRIREAGDWGQSDSPISYNALLVAYGKPADRYRFPGGDAYYSAELVFLAALGAGVQLGQPIRLSELSQDRPDLRHAFLRDWQENPYCQYIATEQACWELIRDTAVLTTQAIMNDPDLERLHP